MMAEATPHIGSPSPLLRAQSWEAPQALCSALSVRSTDRVVSLCETGDMGFAFAIAGAESVTIACASAAQMALGKLKLVAAAELDVERFRSFLGVGPIGQRVFLYHEIRGRLDPATRAFWDGNEESIRLGVLGSGQAEAALAGFRTRVLPLVHRRHTVEQLFDQRSLADQQSFYQQRWNTRRWRALQRVSTVAERLGLWVDSGDRGIGVTGSVLQRIDRALQTAHATADPFVEWLLLGRRRPSSSPLSYLSTDGHAALVRAASRVQWVHAAAEPAAARAAAASCSVLHLADAPDRTDDRATADWSDWMNGAVNSGTRVAYWSRTSTLPQPAGRFAASLTFEPRIAEHHPGRNQSVVHPHLWVGSVR
ncbi:MAG: DUF3419 family protein [Myxococcota bacterium]|nr:DUF3419 family protein [Myxococcota bacterium]